MKKGFLITTFLTVMVFTSVPVLAEGNADVNEEPSVSQQLAARLDESVEELQTEVEALEKRSDSRSSKTPVTSISSEKDLRDFANSINETDPVSYEGVTVELENDIILTDDYWEPVAYFSGIFKGNNHKISNMCIKDELGDKIPRVCNGFFAFLGKKAEITNLNIAGEIEANRNVGGIAAVNLGTISNCVFSGTLKSIDLYAIFGASGAGGIAGINFGNIDRCETEGTYTRAGMYSGGIAGANMGDCFDLDNAKKISNCTNRAAVICDSKEMQSQGGGTGGIAGINSPIIDTENLGSVENLPAQIQNCVNKGRITSNVGITGGIIGLAANSKIEDCINSGGVQTGTLWAGGIVGSYNQVYYFRNMDESTEIIYIRDCTNTGQVDGETRVGGIVGGDEEYSNISTRKTQSVMVIENCVNSGNLNAAGYVGGIDGYSSSAISHCYNMGDIENVNPEVGYNAAGGIASCSKKPITDCFNLGNVDTQIDALSDQYATGGIIGSMGKGTITRCYSTGAMGGNHENSVLEDGVNTVYYGGIAGRGSSASLSGCYFNRDTSGRAKRAVAEEIGAGADHGLRTWQMTGQRAVTFMPELFVQRAAGGFYTPENQTIERVEYSMTPQLGAVKASYALDTEKGFQNAAFVFATVTLPEGEGYTASAAEGFHSEYVALGSDFSFTVALADSHKDNTAAVTANGVELRPDENGLYTIKDVRENQTVSVTLTAPQLKETPAGEGGSDSVAKGSGKTANPKTGEAVKDVALPCMAVSLLVLGMVAVVRKRRG